jgi:ribosomal protein S6
MVSFSSKKSYNCVLIFKEMLNKADFQVFTYSYAQFLKQLGAVDIMAINKTSYELAYPIKKINGVNFIEFSFSISPKALELYRQRLRLDESVLRFFLTKKAIKID